MKKIVSLLIAVMMISTVAFGAAVDSATTDYNTITVNYSGLNSAQATIIAYQIGSEAGMPEYDVENHTMVGIDQAAATGTTGKFEIRLGNPDYTGAVIVAVGGDGNPARYRIEVVGGVPESIETPINCEKGTITLQSGSELNIGHLKLREAYVSNVSGGTIKYVNQGKEVDLNGTMYFDESGTINSAVENTPVTLTLNEGATKTVGFIWNDSTVSAGDYYYAIQGSSSADGKFIIADGLNGNFRFAVAVTNVPAEESLTLSVRE